MIGVVVCGRIWKGTLTKTRLGYKNRLGPKPVPQLFPVTHYTNYSNSPTFGFLLVEARRNTNVNNFTVAKICIAFWALVSSRNASFMAMVEVVISVTLFNLT